MQDILCAIGVIIDLYIRKVIAFDVAEKADSAFIQWMFDSASEAGNAYSEYRWREVCNGKIKKDSLEFQPNLSPNVLAVSRLKQ